MKYIKKIISALNSGKEIIGLLVTIALALLISVLPQTRGAGAMMPYTIIQEVILFILIAYLFVFLLKRVFGIGLRGGYKLVEETLEDYIKNPDKWHSLSQEQQLHFFRSLVYLISGVAIAIAIASLGL